MTDENKDIFFEETKENSVVKASIVDKYFYSWFNIMKDRSKSGRVAYIDLFAGPGRYKDGTVSTPLKILSRAIENKDMSQQLVTLFNDLEPDFVSSLNKEIAALQGVEKLKFAPQVMNEEVGDNVVKMFAEMSLVPTFFFVDPWGYKGLSLRLVESVLKDWGCDCVFFFNYNRISMGINNEKVKKHMVALFGEERLSRLVEHTHDKSPEVREALIIEALAAALNENGKRLVLPFRFRDERGTRTSHHLIFVSKDKRGYLVMKEIMATERTGDQLGQVSFEFNSRVSGLEQGLLFDFSRPIDELPGTLLKHFAGRSLTVDEIYNEHGVLPNPYVKRNYKDVLVGLESQKKISADPPAEKRQMRKGKRTMADHVKITFPR